MTTMPTLTIEGVTISRVICGTNALLGFSHVSAGRDAWIRAHFTPQRIAQVFAHCQELGVTAVMGPLFPRLIAALEETAKLTGQPMTWVATTSMDRAPAEQLAAFQAARQAGRLDEAMAMSRESAAEQLAEIKAAGASFCLLHGAWADRWPCADGELLGYPQVMDAIRAAGLVPGSASHLAGRVVELDQDAAGSALLAAPVNKGGWHMSPSQSEALALYAGLRRPLIAIKTLACGRTDEEHSIESWLRWAALTPGVQAVALGLMLEQEADQSVPVLRAAFEERFS